MGNSSEQDAEERGEGGLGADFFLGPGAGFFRHPGIAHEPRMSHWFFGLTDYFLEIRKHDFRHSGCGFEELATVPRGWWGLPHPT
jgi:hypothetical protein